MKQLRNILLATLSLAAPLSYACSPTFEGSFAQFQQYITFLETESKKAANQTSDAHPDLIKLKTMGTYFGQIREMKYSRTGPVNPSVGIPNAVYNLIVATVDYDTDVESCYRLVVKQDVSLGLCGAIFTESLASVEKLSACPN